MVLSQQQYILDILDPCRDDRLQAVQHSC
jgi:hypothetical protein